MRTNYEVQLEWITIYDPEGHCHNFQAGSDLPDWVSAAQIKELLKNNAIQEFEVLSHGR